MITFGFIIEIYIQERALILENIAYSCNCKIEDRKLDVQPRLSVCQTVCLSVCLSIYLPIRKSINPEEPEPDKIQVTGKTEDGAPGGLGIWGEWLFIFRELGSTGNYFQGFAEQAHSFGD